MGRIKDLPYIDRPREKALRFGIESLSDNELLALIIQSGGKNNSAIDIANEILKRVKKEDLIFETMNFFTAIKGISKVKALHLCSIFEFVKRFETSIHGNSYNIFSIYEIARKYRFYFMKKKQEQFIVIILDNKNRIINEKPLYKGNSNELIIQPDEIINIMKVNNGKAVCFIHNHPSGDIDPSTLDKMTTVKLIDALECNGYKFVDHLIIGERGYYSFNELKNIFY